MVRSKKLAHKSIGRKTPRKKPGTTGVKKLVQTISGIQQSHRYRPSRAALREIRRYQKSVKPFIYKFPFQRLVREIAQNFKIDLRFASSALITLQKASESYLARLLKDIANTKISLETLPGLVYSKLFTYLSLEDIFSLAQCSQKLKYCVYYNSLHPLSTQLQCLKTKYNHYYKETTVFDDLSQFYNINKCVKEECPCQLYKQRKKWVVMNPIFCPCCEAKFQKMLNDEKNVYKYKLSENLQYNNIYLQNKYNLNMRNSCNFDCMLMDEIYSYKICNHCVKGIYCCESCK